MVEVEEGVIFLQKLKKSKIQELFGVISYLGIKQHSHSLGILFFFVLLEYALIYSSIYNTMILLPYTESNVELIQKFIDETKERISNGTTITFTSKAQAELADLTLDYDITVDNIEDAMLNLTPENYFRGIDPSGKSDFEVCAFYTEIGEDNVGIYLKYGLATSGLQILIFSNHAPTYPMSQPFKN